MKSKSSLKYTIAASLVSILLFAAGAWAYSYFTAPTQPGIVEQTPPVANSKTIVAAGDIACSPTVGHAPDTCEHAATASIAEQLKPDAVILLGDLQYDNGRLADFNNAFEPTWGKLKNISYPVPGNHEYGTQDAAGYFDYFGSKAGERGKGYYSFDLGAWHIISLNSNCTYIGGCDESSPEGQWLKADLGATTKSCTLAFWHHPAFTSGKYATNASQLALGKALWQQVEGKVDVVLNGHDHIYEHFSPRNGTAQFTAGTGGKSHYNKSTATDLSQKVVDNAFGVLEFNLKANSYSWRFVGIDGSTLDEGQQTCR